VKFEDASKPKLTQAAQILPKSGIKIARNLAADASCGVLVGGSRVALSKRRGCALAPCGRSHFPFHR